MLRITASTVIALLLLAGAVQANFLETELGARAMGMGGAFVAVADDVTGGWLDCLEFRSSACGPASTASTVCRRTRF